MCPEWADAEKNFLVTIEHDDGVTTTENVLVAALAMNSYAALLGVYTTCGA